MVKRLWVDWVRTPLPCGIVFIAFIVLAISSPLGQAVLPWAAWLLTHLGQGLGILFGVAVVEIVACAVVLAIAGLALEAVRFQPLESTGRPVDIGQLTVAKCAARSFRSYSNPARGAFRYVDRFRFEGGVFGWIDADEMTRPSST